MDASTDPRPPLSEWILDAYDVLCTHRLMSDDQRGMQSVPREQALDILCRADELALHTEDATYALTRLLERGYFYEVDDELRVTTPEH
ncbi:hypothetical protein JMJ58_21075 (plasmid) [Haloterrigena salifodinae]|uniref:Uncharacterized protein n=1 Tax=Haloterrigena salifodinae TaxID=2675099 RepID=A0A8T8E6Y8_9EURY|nr:hypothetical protein [Haloterrigena salifodinae]QRV17479.1 hypothetical protein JMJ58_21075 [Haloterrigena salifodinae]